MIDIHITEPLLDKYNLTLEELIVLMMYDLKITDEVVSTLTEKGYMCNGIVTEKANTALADFLNETKPVVSSDARIDSLTERLMAIFPQGKKEGTPYYWKCNKREVKEKLKKFFVYFGNKYTDEQILTAARAYVNSFNGDYRYMRLLKYFIWKSDVKRNSDDDSVTVEKVSDLASYIENEGQNDLIVNDFDLTLK